jgi:hypothetical protein
VFHDQVSNDRWGSALEIGGGLNLSSIWTGFVVATHSSASVSQRRLMLDRLCSPNFRCVRELIGLKPRIPAVNLQLWDVTISL